MNRLAIALAILTAASAAPAADTSTGDRTIDAYFRAETTRLADRCLADIQSLDDWKAKRGEYRDGPTRADRRIRIDVSSFGA